MTYVEDRMIGRIDRRAERGLMDARQAELKRDARFAIRDAVQDIDPSERTAWIGFAIRRLHEAAVIEMGAHDAGALFGALARQDIRTPSTASERFRKLFAPANDRGRG